MTRILINGTSPGPLLRFQLNDLVSVNVINELDDSAAVHFHGMFQRDTPWFDGVPGVTQCPVAIGDLLVYRFRAFPAGTFWYHAHYRQQLVDGLFAPYIVDLPEEPYRALYTSEWVWMLSDVYDNQSLPLTLNYLSSANPEGVEPPPDAYYVNGLSARDFSQAAQRGEVVRLRLINAAGLSMLNFSIDGLPLTVIEVDTTVVKPLDVSWVVMNVAQRVSILLNFSRLDPVVAASPSLNFTVAPTEEITAGFADHGITLPSDFRGLIWFGGNATVPTMPSYSGAPAAAALPPSDANLLAARPLFQMPTPAATHYLNLTIEFMELGATNVSSGVNRGFMNAWTSPPPTAALLRTPLLFTYLVPTDKPYPFQAAPPAGPAVAAVGSVVRANADGHYIIPHMAVLELMVINKDPGEHPFHIHGHDFWIVASSDLPGAEAAFAGGAGGGYLWRDTVTIPAGEELPDGRVVPGWVKLRYMADNPGIWFFHCHIEWHMAAGLAAVLIEAPDVLQAHAKAGTLVLPPTEREACDSFNIVLENALVANWGTGLSVADPGR